MKLLIADDDEQIRSGMREGIDWAALDIDQVITASNGLEALQRFTEFLPEIVVTDVRMPGMDGLALLKRIKEIKPETRVVILSGYNDFEYLKKAIQLDAVDYEMKPIRVRNLIALIQQIKQDIIRERVSEQEFHKYLASYKANFADELLSGIFIDRHVILEGLKQYFNFDATESLVCLLIELDVEWRANTVITNTATESILDRFQSSDLANFGVCLQSKGGKLVFLLQAKTNSYLYYAHFSNELTGLLREWIREIKSVCSETFSAGISSPGSATEVERLYREANMALSKRLYAGNGTVHIYDSFRAIQNKAIVGLLENPEFFALLSQGRLLEASNMVNDEYDQLKQECMYDRKSISTYSCSLLQLLKVTAQNIPADVTERIHQRINFIEVRESVLLIDEFKELAVSIFQETAARLSKGLSPLMARAEEFIRKNYARELTVEMLAEHAGKTPNYFSHLFKREFGISFKDYINRLRIAKAKELILSSNDLIYEISERVGFSDYTYFTQVFKKIEGYSPAVLRKQRQEHEKK